MGSRASTLLRDEEIEEIKKETGCEYGGVRRGEAGREVPRRLGARSRAAPRPSSWGGASAGRAAGCPLAAARGAVPGEGRRSLCSRLGSAWPQLAPGRDPAIPSDRGRTCLVGPRKSGKDLLVPLPLLPDAAQERP